MAVQLEVHILLDIISNDETFSSNSEVNASELRENLEDSVSPVIHA